MTKLREAERLVRQWEVASEKAEAAWLRARSQPRSVRWSLYAAYETAQRKLNVALHERDVLRAQLGVHPFMKLVTV